MVLSINNNNFEINDYRIVSVITKSTIETQFLIEYGINFPEDTKIIYDLFDKSNGEFFIINDNEKTKYNLISSDTFSLDSQRRTLVLRLNFLYTI